ncbi:MAG: hypothetical protein JSR82_04430 [Verrucomicrobia bacterium]|nr:hypothetical protein [Verrucomicrobiota bacterium]
MVEKWIGLLERVLPDGGGPAEVQSQSAYICLIEGLRCYIDDNVDSMVAVVDAIVDSLDNYLRYWGKRLLVESTVPDSSPLLLRELERQLDDVAFLMNEVNHRRETLIERRFINIQYAVPVVA